VKMTQDRHIVSTKSK